MKAFEAVKSLCLSFFAWLRVWYRFNRQWTSWVLRRGLAPRLASAAASSGMMSIKEVELLYTLARDEVAEGCIVEIGSYHGRSTAALSFGALDGSGARVYTVDPYIDFTGPLGGKFGPENKKRLLENLLLSGATENVWLINLKSEQASAGWTEPIGLLWIDGDHSYEGVKTDFECWELFVLQGGLVAFHDSTDEGIGPIKLLHEILAAGGFATVTTVDTVTVLRKTGPSKQ